MTVPDATAAHGTPERYMAGCRCDSCNTGMASTEYAMAAARGSA